MKTLYMTLLTLSAMALCTQSSFAGLIIGGDSVDNSPDDYLRYERYMTVPFNKQNGPDWEAGNDTTGKTQEEIQTIVDKIHALETDSVQKEIATKMKVTEDTFSFVDISKAKAGVTQRLEAIDIMIALNRYNPRYLYYSSIKPPSTDAPSWHEGKNPNKHFYFRQTSSNAYDAIEQLFTPPWKTYGECQGAMIACIWWGSSRAMGKLAFNALYPGSEALNMDVDIPTNDSWERNLSSATDVIPGPSGTNFQEDHSADTYLVPGDCGYWRNYNYAQVVNDDRFYKFNWLDPGTSYPWAGENVLYFGLHKYEELGVTAKTAYQMREELRFHYNQDLRTVIDSIAANNMPAQQQINNIDEGAEAQMKIDFIAIGRPKI